MDKIITIILGIIKNILPYILVSKYTQVKEELKQRKSNEKFIATAKRCLNIVLSNKK